MKRVLSLLLLLSTFQLTYAQFEMDQTLTIEEYVNDILLGSGVQATNVTFTGDLNQIGYLTNDGTPDVYPMQGGLVLACENAENFILGGVGGFITGVSGDADLLDLANSVPDLIGESFSVSSVNDVAILEFDFVATGDTVSFNYSFGSDEWTTYINSSFNDIFAFFLSGPGIVGPYDAPAEFPDGAINIAGVPDTDPNLPVTISSVHNGNPNGTDCMNCEYYVYNVPQQDVQINAFTTLFTAESEVICGETYHIKLAIADGTDTALKSVVVLEEGSFTSNSVVQVDLTIDVGGPEANTIYEDCGAATLSFTRPIETILEIEEMVFIEYGGTAEELFDYNDLPDTIVFAPFVETISFEVLAYDDGIDEDTELVILEILNLAACSGEGLTSYFEFYIADTADPLVVDGFDAEMCLGNSIDLIPEISGGYGNYVYTWDTGDDTQMINVSPLVDITYNLIVSDTCGLEPDDADFVISVPVYPELEVEITPGNLEIACGGVNITATATGGNGEYLTWTWYNEDGVILSTWSNQLWVSEWTASDEIWVDVTDGCGFTATDNIDVEYVDITPIEIDLEDMVVICNQVFTVEPIVSGGGMPYWYTWSVDGTFLWDETAATYTTSTMDEIEITLTVQDNCFQNETVTIDITVESPEIELTMPEDQTGNCLEEFILIPEIDGGSDGFSYVWNDGNSDISADQVLTITPGTESSYEFYVEDVCGASAVGTVDILIVNPPVFVELGEDLDASCIDFTPIIADASGGSGTYAYQWIVDGENVGDGPVLNWQSFETIEITVEIIDACNEENTDALVLNIPNIPLEIVVTEDQDICPDEEVQLTAFASGGEEGFYYNWSNISNSDSSQTVYPSETTLYEIIAFDICGKVISEEVLVTVHPIDVAASMNYVSSSSVQFESTVMPPCIDCDYIYTWDFGDGTFSNEIHPFHAYDGQHHFNGEILVMNEYGCIAKNTFFYKPPLSLYIPNSFTPNNDGVNEYFKVVADGIEEYEIRIFNRWGEIVFQSKNIDEIWLGDVQEGKYYYSINDTYNYIIDLKGYNTDAFQQTGSITILR